jgi:hypothetical protein
MAVSIMSNLSCQTKFLDMILPLGVLRSVQQNLLRVWSDTDIEDLLKTLQTKLQTHVDGKGTWDEYRKELLSGQLDWTPAHRSKAFWSENVSKFSDNDFMVLKSLVVILQSERLCHISLVLKFTVLLLCSRLGSCCAADKDKKATPIEIAVVLNDLAMFMKHHSNGTGVYVYNSYCWHHVNSEFLSFSPLSPHSGKKILTALNCKEAILSYLMSENDSIKREAIVCVSEMLTASM